MRYGRLACVCILAWIFSLSLVSAKSIPPEVGKRLFNYQGTKVTGINKTELGGNAHVYEVSLEIEGAQYNDVIKFYRQEAKKRGWRIFNDVARDYGYMLLCHDGHYKIDISVTPKGNKMMVRVSLEKRR
ncbi:hypothetical protein QUF80_24235 [Desulfococcaceae bacterium HSG8]|nr:hypothetical protein [Desulfococcaceae bacterium HSG8]